MEISSPWPISLSKIQEKTPFSIMPKNGKWQYGPQSRGTFWARFRLIFPYGDRASSSFWMSVLIYIYLFMSFRPRQVNLPPGFSFLRWKRAGNSLFTAGVSCFWVAGAAGASLAAAGTGLEKTEEMKRERMGKAVLKFALKDQWMID